MCFSSRQQSGDWKTRLLRTLMSAQTCCCLEDEKKETSRGSLVVCEEKRKKTPKKTLLRTAVTVETLKALRETESVFLKEHPVSLTGVAGVVAR